MEIGFLQEIKAIIKSLVISSPHAITINNLNKDFRDMEGYSIPYGKFGYQNLESFLRSIDDTIIIFGYGTMATLHSVTDQKSNHIYKMIQCQKKNKHSRLNTMTAKFGDDKGLFSNTGKNKFNKMKSIETQEQNSFDNKRRDLKFSSEISILRKKQNASWTSGNTISVAPKKVKPKDILHLENQFKDKLCINSLQTENILTDNDIRSSFKGMKEFPKQFKVNSDLIHELIQSKSGSKKEYEQIGSNKRTNSQCDLEHNYEMGNTHEKVKSNFFEISLSNAGIFDDINEAVPQFAADNLVFRFDFPDNAVLFGHKIDPYELPMDIKKDSIIGIFVSEIHNPFKFWFHIHKENHQLDILMNNMECFYESMESDEFIIPAVCHIPGQICAALYNSMWHRGEIISHYNNKTKVFFVDYGTVSEVNSSNVKYLASVFCNIASQAIRGSLSHIKPKGMHWTHQATKCFLSFAKDLMLYGKVTDIDTENRVLYMIICNSNGPMITQINKRMVEKQFALHDEEWQDQRILKNGFRNHHPREDFPTFEMLESGEYPSLSEIIDLLNIGIYYEEIIDRQIFNLISLSGNTCPSENVPIVPFPLLNTNPFRCDIIFDLLQPINHNILHCNKRIE